MGSEALSHESKALKAIGRGIRIPLFRGKRAEELFRFGLVGICGFVVDGGLLSLLVTGFGTNPLVARGISFPIAVFTTWLINRRFTFDVGWSSAKGKISEFGRYLIVQLTGAAVNLAIYGLLLMLVPMFWRMPLYALSIASGFALIVNYLGARHIAFRPAR
jgi:putative flippase GtrA